MEFNCPYCKGLVQWEAELAFEETLCPYCNQLFVMPASPPLPKAVAMGTYNNPTPVQSAVQYQKQSTYEKANYSRNQHQASNISTNQIVSGSIIAFLLFFFIIFYIIPSLTKPSLDDFSRINEGTSVNAVNEILGSEGQLTDESGSYKTYIWKGSDWYVICVFYCNSLKSKAQIGL